jgi:serine/alanine adding enzyme
MPSPSVTTRHDSAGTEVDDGMADLRVTRRLDEPAWRDFVATEPGTNIFHTPEMTDVFARAAGHRVSTWGTVDPTGALLALFLPVEVTLGGNMSRLARGATRAFVARAVAYGGAACVSHEVGRRALSELIDAYRRQAGPVLFTEVRHLCDMPEASAALWAAGFAHERHLNYLIHLDRSEADLWGALSRSARQRIRSGERKGVTVEAVAAPAGARGTHATDGTDGTGGTDGTDGATGTDEAYRLLEVVYRRARVPLADRSLFDAAVSVLSPRGMCRLVVARLGGDVIGARFVLLHRGRMIDWYAGSDRAFAAYSPNEVLVWHVLRWGRQQGYDVFDFGGAGRPDEHYGPREFKAKFGGELVDFGRDVLVHTPMRLRLSRATYGVSRRLPRPAWRVRQRRGERVA